MSATSATSTTKGGARLASAKDVDGFAVAKGVRLTRLGDGKSPS